MAQKVLVWVALCCVLGALLVRGKERRCVGYTSCYVDILAFQNVCDAEEAAAVFASYECVVGAVALPEYSAMEWDYSHLASLQLYRTDGTKGVLSFPLEKCSTVGSRGIYVNGTIYGSVVPGEEDVLLYRDTACASTETYAQQYGVTYNATIALGAFGESMVVSKDSVFFYDDAICGTVGYQVTTDLCTEGPWVVGNQTYSYASTFQTLTETSMEVLDAPPQISPEEVELDCGGYAGCKVGMVEFFDGADCRGSSFLLTDAPQCLYNSIYSFPYSFMIGVYDDILPVTNLQFYNTYGGFDNYYRVRLGCTSIENVEHVGLPEYTDHWHIDGTSYYSVFASVDGDGKRKSSYQEEEISIVYYTDTNCTVGASSPYVVGKEYAGVYSVFGPDSLYVSDYAPGGWGRWNMQSSCYSPTSVYQFYGHDGDCETLGEKENPSFEIGGVPMQSYIYYRNITIHHQAVHHV